MIKISVSRLATTLALSAAVVGLGALPAGARPDDGRPGSPRVVVVESQDNCPLRRLDRQLVRCDSLTGDGVAAPLFIPKL